MNFELTGDQKMIVETVASFVQKELPIERMRKMRDDDAGYSKEVWRQMGELGWLGIMFPEEVGGFGGSFVDASLVLEQFGTTLVSEPYVASVILAGNALVMAASEEQQQKWLAPMIAGETTLALAYAERESRFNVTMVKTSAKQEEGGWRIAGEKVWVLNGHAADQLIVSARTDDGIALFVVDAAHEGVSRKTVQCMDGAKAAMIQFDCVVDGEHLLTEDGADTLEKLMDLGAAAACAEGYGIMTTILEMTVEYLKMREQFGVKIGTFQALQHRAVDMFIETQLAKSTGIMAAIRVSSKDENERKSAISAAKAQLSVGGKYCSQQAIQLHGGIGVTDEHDVGLYFKRMHVLNTLFGDEEYHVQRYMSLPTFESASRTA